MDRIITDNSKVNENLLNEVNNVNKQNKELIVKNMDLQEQLLIQRVSQQRELLIAWEQYKKANWYESDAIDVEKILMSQFLAIYSG